MGLIVTIFDKDVCGLPESLAVIYRKFGRRL
jgi:hypothetical protein